MTTTFISPLDGRAVQPTRRRLGYVLAAGLAAVAVAGYCGYRLFNNTATPLLTWTFFGMAAAFALFFATRTLQQSYAKYVCLAMAVPLLAMSFWLYGWRSEHIELYNAAMTALDKHDAANAMKLLEASSKAYQQELQRGQFAQLFLPKPRRDVEARAHNHKGVLFVQARKVKEAVGEFFTSLQFNPGNRYLGLTSQEAARWENDSRKPKANLEKLYRMGQADGRAKGKQGRQGQPQPGQGQPQEQRDPGKDPANSHGRKGPGKL